MRQCQKCYTPNSDASQYCESCGTSLIQGETVRPTMAYQETRQGYPHYTVPPIQYPVPDPGYTSIPEAPIYSEVYSPVPSVQAGQFIYPNKEEGRRKKSGVALFFGILLYLIGGFTTAFGLACTFIPTNNNTIVGVAFLIVCLLEILGLALVLAFYHRSRLRGWLRIVLFVCLTILAVIALVVAFAAAPPHQSTTNAEYVALGMICMIYGLAMDVIALI